MNIFTRLSSYFSRFLQSSTQDPVRDWLGLLMLSAVILVGTVVWSMWVFDSASRGGTIGTVHTDTSKLFDTKILDTVQTVFETRALEEEKFMNGTYHFTDPSQ